MSIVRPLLLVSLTAFVAAGHVRAQEVAAGSPFLPGASASAGVVTENAPLELRGIVGTGNNRLFAIFDPSSKQTRWVGLNEAGNAFTVKTHDEASDTVSLDYAGRSLSLRLPESKITPLALAAAPAATTGRGRGAPANNSGQPPAPRELSPEQAKQLENVAAEVARRRALRNSTQNGAPPAPPGNR